MTGLGMLALGGSIVAGLAFLALAIVKWRIKHGLK